MKSQRHPCLHGLLVMLQAAWPHYHFCTGVISIELDGPVSRMHWLPLLPPHQKCPQMWLGSPLICQQLQSTGMKNLRWRGRVT